MGRVTTGGSVEALKGYVNGKVDDVKHYADGKVDEAMQYVDSLPYVANTTKVAGKPLTGDVSIDVSDINGLSMISEEDMDEILGVNNGS